MYLRCGSPARRTDMALAAALLLLGQVEAVFGTADPPRWHQALLTLLWTAPLVWRRRFPVPVLAVVIAVGPSIELVNAQGGVTSYALAAMLASYTVGRELDAPISWWGPALTVLLPWTWFTVTGGSLSDFVFVALLYGGTWAVGAVLRQRALHVQSLSREAEELRARADEREQQAVAEERARIARELHDVVSHSISVITVQTQAARLRLGAEHPEAPTLAGIEGTARQAMGEMRRLLGVLRAADDPLALSPQPGLDQVERLVSDVRSTGLDVELVSRGTPVPLPPGVDLAAYRVVQEGLTNACKHAPSSRVRVLVDRSPSMVVVTVEDDGAGPPASSGVPGHGLIGMRERVQLYTGTLHAGPRPAGGFVLRAELPLIPSVLA